MIETYRMIAGRIRAELKELDQVVARITHIWQQVEDQEGIDQPTDLNRQVGDYHSRLGYQVDAVALNLHSFYTGIEHILDVIARGVDQTRPSGEAWHKELLLQMSAEIPDVRPPVLRRETRAQLDRYRGFRHVVRNVYTYRLDPAQIALLIQQLPTTFESVSNDLLAFADWLEHIAKEA
jgi:hypothetical protein